jgi:hypothetical protein
VIAQAVQQQLSDYHIDVNTTTDLVTQTQLELITYLNLYGNQLTTLPDTIGELTALTYLNLRYNQLTCLADGVLIAGRSVYLQGNPGYSDETETLPLCGSEPSPSPSASPSPSGSPEPSSSPNPSGSPEPSGSPSPSSSPEPSQSPSASESPEPSTSPTPSVSPEPSGSPDPSGSPEPTGTPDPSGPPAESPSAGQSVVPGESDLTEATKGGVQAPDSAEPGREITIQVGAAHSGQQVTAWLFGDNPVPLGEHTVAVDGTIRLTIPATAAGASRVAVYNQNGTLIGWDDITLTTARQATSTSAGSGQTSAVATSSGRDELDFTGASSANRLAIAAGLLLLAGAGAISTARRWRAQAQ